VKEAVFHPEAREEVSESMDFYERRLAGLGLRFLTAVEHTTERIAAAPEAGAPIETNYRKRIVPGFPYNIIYRVWEDHVFLVAVAHHRRRPGYWRERADRR
jgi:toxin ParE1/3/4